MFYKSAEKIQFGSISNYLVSGTYYQIQRKIRSESENSKNILALLQSRNLLF